MPSPPLSKLLFFRTHHDLTPVKTGVTSIADNVLHDLSFTVDIFVFSFISLKSLHIHSIFNEKKNNKPSAKCLLSES